MTQLVMGKVKKANLRFAFEGSNSDLKQAIANHNPLDLQSVDVLYITTYNTAQHRFIDLVIVNDQDWQEDSSYQESDPRIPRRSWTFGGATEGHLETLGRAE